MYNKSGLFARTGLFQVKQDILSNLMKLGVQLSDQKQKQQELYFQYVQGIMTAFQLIEESMKVYLGTVFSSIRELLKKRIPFQYEIDDIENMNLRYLLRIFKKYNRNIRLQRKIENIIDERNYFAHRGFILSLGSKEEILEKLKLLDKKTKRCEKLYPELLNILKQLREEQEKIEKVSSLSTRDPGR